MLKIVVYKFTTMKKITPLDTIQLKLEDLRREFSVPAEVADEKLFIALCEKYFFPDGPGKFDINEAESHIVDGANDGGIDAILNDSDGNLVIIQSKFYKDTPLTKDTILMDLEKITDSIRRIENYCAGKLKNDLVQAYLRAKDNMNDESIVRIVYFTSYNAKPTERKKTSSRIEERYPHHNIEIYYASEIVEQIDCIDNAKICVESGELTIDNPNNKLVYEDSIIVNISARSLWKLYKTNQNGLLGMNLRYYIRNATVDNGIKETIEKEPETFWYRNNGITIICDRWSIDGDKIKLHNFSIINGGQTTNRIANNDIETDFFILCKIVKALGKTIEEQEKFIIKIAEASNSQKPIKVEDLKANAPEQNKLKQELSRVGVTYITKRGIKKSKSSNVAYKEVTMTPFGKLSLSTRLKLPGTARNKGKAMYTKDNYYLIYRNVNVHFMSEFLRIEHYCDKFIKEIKPRKDIDDNLKRLIGLSKTHILACTSFLCELYWGIIDPNDIAPILDSPQELKDFFRKNKNESRKLIKAKFSLESEEIAACNELFYIICNEVIMNAYRPAKELNKSLDPANFLKSDEPFLTTMVTNMHRSFNSPYGKSPLRLAVEKVCGVK